MLARKPVTAQISQNALVPSNETTAERGKDLLPLGVESAR